MTDAIDRRLPAVVFIRRTESTRYPFEATRVPRCQSDAYGIGVGKTKTEAITDITPNPKEAK